MEPLQVHRAFAVLDELDSLVGQARNRRLEILGENQSNTILREIFRLTYDWRIEIGIVPVGLGIKRNRSSSQSLSLDQSWIDFMNLVTDVQMGVGFLMSRKKFNKFFEICNPVVGKWAERIINRDLKIFLSTKMLMKVWGDGIFIPFKIPPNQRSEINGMRTFIFIHNHRPVTYTEGFRKFAFANDISSSVVPGRRSLIVFRMFSLKSSSSKSPSAKNGGKGEIRTLERG